MYQPRTTFAPNCPLPWPLYTPTPTPRRPRRANPEAVKRKKKRNILLEVMQPGCCYTIKDLQEMKLMTVQYLREVLADNLRQGNLQKEWRKFPEDDRSKPYYSLLPAKTQKK